MCETRLERSKIFFVVFPNKTFLFQFKKKQKCINKKPESIKNPYKIFQNKNEPIKKEPQLILLFFQHVQVFAQLVVIHGP